MLDSVSGKRAARGPEGRADGASSAKRARTAQPSPAGPAGLPCARGASAGAPAPRQAFVAPSRGGGPSLCGVASSKGGGSGSYRKFDAAALKLTLQTLLECKGSPAGERGLDAIDQVARRLNQSRQYVESWVQADGSLQKKMYYVARLEGYEAAREDLQDLLQRLGQQEAAAALPAEVPRQPRPKPPSGADAGGYSRRNLTASDVLTLLQCARQGKAVPEILAEHPYTKSTVQRWTGHKQWSGQDLGQALSRMEGYGLHRPALQKLVGELQLHDGPLPEPPAEQKQHVSAALLCDALSALVERLEHPRPGQNKDTLEDLADAVGLKKNTLAKWLKADGSPRMAASSLARLPDYAQHQPQLKALLTKLRHADAAAALPDAPTSARAQVTADLVARAVEQLAKGQASTQGIANALDISRNAVSGFLKISGGSVALVDPERLSGLPDYPEQRTRLQLGLRAAGLEEQARRLPPVKVDTAELLSALRGKGREAAAAMAAMQADRRLSAEDAARRHGLPPEAFAAVVRPGGQLRDRGRVEARLARLEPHLSQGLDELLAMLGRASRDEVAGSGGSSSLMKRVRLAPAGHEPAKLFIVPQGRTTGPKRSQLENLYASNVALQRGPRSYESDRGRQALRWLSTVLRLLVPDCSEVQCYFDEHSGSVAVAAGRTSDLRKLESLLADGKFLTKARDELNGRVDTLSEREYRHVQKLFAQLKAYREGKADDPAADLILGAIRRKAFVVPIENFRAGGSDIHLHAERRLNHWSKQTHGEPVDPARLAGTMRPCGTCADELQLDERASRGPFWMSAAAQARIDTEAAIQRQVDRSIGTSVTRTRERKLTLDVNTDSDSDA